MYLTMNRFRVKQSAEAAFEALWTGRDSHLPQVKGFAGFHLFKGALEGDCRLYISHTMWENAEAFTAWTKSEAFRAAHAGAKSSGEMYDGPPVLELFESVQRIGV